MESADPLSENERHEYERSPTPLGPVHGLLTTFHALKSVELVGQASASAGLTRLTAIGGGLGLAPSTTPDLKPGHPQLRNLFAALRQSSHDSTPTNSPQARPTRKRGRPLPERRADTEKKLCFCS